jgi:hypothetical protein
LRRELEEEKQQEPGCSERGQHKQLVADVTQPGPSPPKKPRVRKGSPSPPPPPPQQQQQPPAPPAPMPIVPLTQHGQQNTKAAGGGSRARVCTWCLGWHDPDGCEFRK